MELTQSYNRKEFLNFIEKQLLPDDFCELCDDMYYCHNNIKSIVTLGKCEESLNELTLLEVKHTSNNDARVSLSREIFRYMKNNFIEYALVVFIPENNPDIYRLSFVKMSPKDNNGKLDFENSSPKRYSFLLGKNQLVRTPNEYLFNKGKIKTIEDLEDRFSIEVLTKQFYNELFEWYETAINEFVPYPRTEKNKEEHIIRLITRLMFVWFVKQKKLVPDALFDINKLQELLSDFDPYDRVGGSYYNAILQNLFFATLNCEISERSFASDTTNAYKGFSDEYRIKTKFRDNNGKSWFNIPHDDVIKIFETIPFLNGGLFECLIKEEDTQDPDDGFSRIKNKRSLLPNNLFFDKEKGIISILKKYNWTIEENSPSDIEVALDPELLGKVFENLLGTYNPETRETARKDSGSFYTPRAIVQYMTDESLIAYLTKNTGENSEKIHKLITSLDLPEEIKNDKSFCETIINLLQNIKILDPACGSGAFPMGLLNRIVEIINKIDPSINSYDIKHSLIENCIYGVDIQTIAIQISKLRCFISLICEQNSNNNKDDNYGIHPLPNLETKFVAANTLVSLNKDITEEIKLVDKTLEDKRKELFDIRVHQMLNVSSYRQKRKLREKDKQLCDQITLLVSDRIGKPNEDFINISLQAIKDLEKSKEQYSSVKMENIIQKSCKTLFDDEEQKILSIDVNKKKREEIDRIIAKIHYDIQKERKKVLSSKTEQEIKKLIGWNPYKPTHSSDFFDAQWMFNLSEGFDIVIGNPPYIQLQKFKGKDIQTVYKNQNYKTYEATGDLYCLFYEKGIELLKDGGILCYITSNKWMRAGYGESLRSFFIDYNPTLLIDLGANVFTSATVDTNILLVEKKDYEKKTLSCTLKDRSQEMSVFVRQNAIEMEYTKDAWAILNPIEQSIKAKIEKYGTPLKDWDISINYGIKTGCNEAFIISGEKRKELIAEDPKSDEIIRPILRGRDIKRYGYEFADLYIIATFPSKHYNIDDYPAIKNWLINGDWVLTKTKGNPPTPIGSGKLRLKQTGEEYEYEGIKFKSRKKTNNKWFETQDSIAYWNDFSKQKIMYSEIVRSPQFYLDNNGQFYSEATGFVMTGEKLEYLLMALHSKLLTYAFKTFYAGGGLGESGYRYKKAFLENLPIYYPTTNEYMEMFNHNEYQSIENLLNEAYHLTEEEIRFISENMNFLE